MNEDSLSSVVEGCSSNDPFRSNGLVQPQNAPTRTNETVSVEFTMFAVPTSIHSLQASKKKFGLMIVNGEFVRFPSCG
jgi:hypothetical protein